MPTRHADVPQTGESRAPEALLLAQHGAALAAGVRRLALQSDVTKMAAIATETAAELVGAVRAQFYYHQPDDDVLWTLDGREHSSSEGLAGAAIRRRTGLSVADVGSSPHYRGEVDDPQGRGTERIAAQPIVATSGEAHAVVVLARPATAPPFSSSELALLDFWAQQVAPLFHVLHVEREARELHLAEGVVGPSELYRAQALDELVSGNEELAVAFDRSPLSLRWSYAFAAVVVLATATFFALVKVREYASGPAFIVSTTHHDVVASRDVVVDEVLTRPGAVVTVGQILATHEASTERADRVRARAEFDRALVDRLRNPADRSVELQVASAKAVLDRAEARLSDTALRAPISGKVADVRIEPGHAVGAGEVVMTIADGETGLPLVRALVPGRHRPALAEGQEVILDLDGFSSEPQRLRVSSISDGVVGATELQRTVAPQVAEMLATSGPLVLVEGELLATDIEADGRTWHLHDGMMGRADVVVRSKPILFVLFPKLEGLLRDV